MQILDQASSQARNSAEAGLDGRRCGRRISDRRRRRVADPGHAESILAAGSERGSPDWFTWFTPVPLAAFRGKTQLTAGHLPQARDTHLGVLEDRSITVDKQHTIIFGDPAAVEAAQQHPEAACDYAIQALDQLGRTWYATGMGRVSKSASPSSRTPSWTASRPSMTGSMTGRPRSARSSIKRGYPAGQLGE
jgi:hypothetical protein